jgi:hypothetical protein
VKDYLATVAVTIGVAIAGALIITVLFGHQRGAAPAHQAAVERGYASK